MVLAHHLLLLLLMALHARAAQAAPEQAQEAVDSLKDSLAAWQKDGLEPLDQPTVGGLLKSFPLPILILKHKRDHAEVAGQNTTQAPKPQEPIESIFCHGAGCMIGVLIVLVAVPVGIVLCSAAIYWWCDRKRRLSQDQQERVGLISSQASHASLSEPDQAL